MRPAIWGDIAQADNILLLQPADIPKEFRGDNTPNWQDENFDDGGGWIDLAVASMCR